ncbi:diguanylate cyclase [Chitinivorax tropicus]|uniref:diguanylate cyclase n=1 Tax=Chitinivorax tropicus TaxID=714531 RepID=A0A840MQL9_9PROT|nr:GGDEF domain-containing protein [Chitinivorax tropicus]MBB5018746.1 diguanylate cyclase [Chitinivorax tropicus]
MEKNVNPSLVARETLKLMAQRKVMPDPENYRKIYNEIAGISDTQPGGGAGVDALLEALFKPVQQAAKGSPARMRAIKELEQLAEKAEWSSFLERYEDEILHSLASRHFKRSWPELIRELLKEWDLHRPGFSSSKKKEALERVLINFGNDLTQLNEKLSGMLKSWSEGGDPEAGVETADEDTSVAVAAPKRPAESAPSVSAEGGGMSGLSAWSELVALIVNSGLVARLKPFPDLQGEAEALLVALREVRDDATLQRFAIQVKKFCVKLELHNDHDERLFTGLLRLLELLVDNIGELVVDDQWIEGQVVVLRDMIDNPLNARQIYAAEASFKELVLKQGALKHSLQEAKETFKHMVATFIDRLGVMSTSTGGYHDKVRGYAERIQQADDMAQLNQLLADLMNDTRSVQSDMARSRDEMLLARQQANEAEERIRNLENELRAISEKVKQDHLTGALNRRGLDDAFSAEVSRVEREAMPLCVALLDVDNFKQLNDRLGHSAGDGALVHLAGVVRDTLRPTDVVARYGGEEFVVLLVNTDIDEGLRVMERLQRELTKRFFLFNNERLLITFSAGVARYRPGEDQDSVVGRADDAMYRAKKAGKNKVFAAE